MGLPPLMDSAQSWGLVACQCKWDEPKGQKACLQSSLRACVAALSQGCISCRLVSAGCWQDALSKPSGGAAHPVSQTETAPLLVAGWFVPDRVATPHDSPMVRASVPFGAGVVRQRAVAVWGGSTAREDWNLSRSLSVHSTSISNQVTYFTYR